MTYTAQIPPTLAETEQSYNDVLAIIVTLLPRQAVLAFVARFTDGVHSMQFAA